MTRTLTDNTPSFTTVMARLIWATWANIPPRQMTVKDPR